MKIITIDNTTELRLVGKHWATKRTNLSEWIGYIHRVVTRHIYNVLTPNTTPRIGNFALNALFIKAMFHCNFSVCFSIDFFFFRFDCKRPVCRGRVPAIIIKVSQLTIRCKLLNTFIMTYAERFYTFYNNRAQSPIGQYTLTWYMWIMLSHVNLELRPIIFCFSYIRWKFQTG